MIKDNVKIKLHKDSLYRDWGVKNINIYKGIWSYLWLFGWLK